MLLSSLNEAVPFFFMMMITIIWRRGAQREFLNTLLIYLSSRFIFFKHRSNFDFACRDPTVPTQCGVLYTYWSLVKKILSKAVE